MEKVTFDEINEKYELEIDRVVGTIEGEKAKRVLLQFPEGMKPYAQVICDEISSRCDEFPSRAGCECFIWMGTCFGACDVPLEVSGLGVDLIVQFGHSSWKFGGKEIEVL